MSGVGVVESWVGGMSGGERPACLFEELPPLCELAGRDMTMDEMFLLFDCYRVHEGLVGELIAMGIQSVDGLLNIPIQAQTEFHPTQRKYLDLFLRDLYQDLQHSLQQQQHQPQHQQQQ